MNLFMGGYEENKTKIAVGWGIAAVAVVAGLAIAATVVTGGAAAGVAVATTAVIVGTISAGANIASQMVSNKLNGTQQTIDGAAVVISGATGAISGAVAASPLKVGGQILGNGILSGLASYTEGGSISDITFNTLAGAAAGGIGGSGPQWEYNTNIFVPRNISTPGVTHCYSLSTSARMTFKNLWRGLNPDEYVGEVFTGISKGFYKGLAASNTISTVTGYCLESEKMYGVTEFVKKLWDEYKPDFLKDTTEKENDEE